MEDKRNGLRDQLRMPDSRSSDGGSTSSHDEDGDVMRSPDISSPKTATPNFMRSPSAPSGSGSGDQKDLPMELLQAGWRKFFSNREKQVYYFNTRTKQSLWEMPPMPGTSSVCAAKS